MSDTRKAALAAEMDRTRAATLRLLERVPDEFLKVRVHDFYSPIGWHFGHVGMTEEFWTCRRAMGRSPLDDRLSFLFANLPENPKDDRIHLPSREGIVAYLAATRARALAALDDADLEAGDPLVAGGYAWEFARLHECQHQETIVELLQLIHKAEWTGRDVEALADYRWPASRRESEMVTLPGGSFVMGTNDPFAYDNEKQAHAMEVAPFALDRTPVTAAQWKAFLDDGGYRRPELWTSQGWAWRLREAAAHPEYWQPTRSGESFLYYGPAGLRVLHPDEPVSSISWYEADAYARWADKRLPTEAEWEFAAAFDPAARQSRRYPWGDCPPGRREADFGLDGARPDPVGRWPAEASAFGLLDMAGGVWEWTASPFLPYPGFHAYPYDGYSKEHMDGRHFVCRGGSWATAASIVRCQFRNWYVPTYRQGFLGLRCAVDVS